ncbi:hypothetical protein GCM10010520_68130 [Rhizobium viscosum]
MGAAPAAKAAGAESAKAASAAIRCFCIWSSIRRILPVDVSYADLDAGIGQTFPKRFSEMPGTFVLPWHPMRKRE